MMGTEAHAQDSPGVTVTKKTCGSRILPQTLARPVANTWALWTQCWLHGHRPHRTQAGPTAEGETQDGAVDRKILQNFLRRALLDPETGYAV